MRMIRGATIGEDDRADRSIRDHMNIIQALEARDTERAETWCASMRSASPSTSPSTRLSGLTGGTHGRSSTQRNRR
jgi:hypothetical protein